MKDILAKENGTPLPEGGFPTYPNGQGGITVGNGPANAPLSEQIQYGPESGWDPTGGRSGATAVFHTHPYNSNGLPSSPGNTSGSGSGDTGYAVAKNLDNYVISNRGLSVARGNGPIKPGKDWNPWIIQGNGIDDWLKKLKVKCSK